MTRYFVAGGAGFIGSHLVRGILAGEPDAQVLVFDNFSSGRMWHLDGLQRRDSLGIVRGDLKHLAALTAAVAGADIVFHFASNPDIAKALTQPDIDFWEGTYLTANLLEAMRTARVRRLLYASGSGIYGDTGLTQVGEHHSPLLPISTYGASKLAGEALISAYCAMFEMRASALRFANVVGPHQTHGVAYDFVRKLTADPHHLEILGDGTQSKSYLHVDDVIECMRLVARLDLPGFSYFNVATLDAMTVAEIADLVIAAMGLTGVERSYGRDKRGWKGDVPVIRLDSTAIRSLGWSNRYSAREALCRSIESICQDARQRKFGWGDK